MGSRLDRRLVRRLQAPRQIDRCPIRLVAGPAHKATVGYITGAQSADNKHTFKGLQSGTDGVFLRWKHRSGRR